MKNTPISPIFGTMLVAFPCMAMAQNVPNIGQVLNQVSASPQVPKSAEALPQVGNVPMHMPMNALPSGPRVQVKAFDIVGNRDLDKAQLLALIEGAAGKAYTLEQLETLAQTITRYYRAKGYFVARAYIPEQEVSAGVIKIRVVEGNYGQFHLSNTSLVRDGIVQAMLDDIKGYDIVSLDTLERAMLIINDTPGVMVTRADVMPGQKVGTSDFAITTEKTPGYDGYVMLDNYGSTATGKHRLSAGYNSNSPTERGDRLTLSGMSTEGGGLVNGRVAYSMLLRPNGLRGELALGQTEYALGGAYTSVGAKGTAKTLDANFTYPIRRIRAQTLEASANFSHKTLRDSNIAESTDVPKQLHSMSGGLLWRDESMLWGKMGLTLITANVTVGHLSIRDSIALASDALGAQTEGHFQKLSLGLTRTSSITPQLTLTGSFKHQNSFNGKNLDSSERMSVSGISGVYAYPAGELMGTNASLAKIELTHALPAVQALTNSASIFASKGHAKASKAVSSTDQARTISDVGLGWKANYNRLVLQANLAYRLEKAQPLSEPASRTRLLVQANWVY
jgi:hemolysin activation/secretion protein